MCAHRNAGHRPTKAGMALKDVPDPYYDGEGDFEHTLDLIEAGVRGIIADINGRQ